ncbi:MAG: ubiquinol-cytochrome c reductase iron-sulfur subunit [Ectothiorhodospiraceae bacterium]|nr:ubiquinol-cytochrome c reductase iron-sulfur subunit [Ectothiorhodospiraceae bacterium]
MSADGADLRRRRFLTGAVTVVGGVGAAFAAWPFASAWQPSERARAIGAPIEVDISKLEPGRLLTDKWQGKPVWIMRRTEDVLTQLPGLDGELRDPKSEEDQQPSYATNEYRSIKPEVLVLVGLCTHLGCSPTYLKAGDPQLGAEWKGGFFCPCHGSRFDLAGRVFAGVPAPTNLVVPPHKYLSDTRILIGEDSGGAA